MHLAKTYSPAYKFNFEESVNRLISRRSNREHVIKVHCFCSLRKRRSCCAREESTIRERQTRWSSCLHTIACISFRIRLCESAAGLKGRRTYWCCLLKSRNRQRQIASVHPASHRPVQKKNVISASMLLFFFCQRYTDRQSREINFRRISCSCARMSSVNISTTDEIHFYCASRLSLINAVLRIVSLLGITSIHTRLCINSK